MKNGQKKLLKVSGLHDFGGVLVVYILNSPLRKVHFFDWKYVRLLWSFECQALVLNCIWNFILTTSKYTHIHEIIQPFYILRSIIKSSSFIKLKINCIIVWSLFVPPFSSSHTSIWKDFGNVDHIHFTISSVLVFAIAHLLIFFPLSNEKSLCSLSYASTSTSTS